MSARARLGVMGEDAAARLYARGGFKIVERNYRCSSGEIDVIARRGRLFVFCEVKTRSSDAWGGPEEAVGYRKRARLRKLAAQWLSDRRPRGSVQVRFDVVSVVAGGSEAVVTHIPDAF